MNNRDTIKTRADAVEKRYGKTTRGDTKRTKTKVKIKPKLGKGKLGFQIKAKF